MESFDEEKRVRYCIPHSENESEIQDLGPESSDDEAHEKEEEEVRMCGIELPASEHWHSVSSVVI